MFMDAWGFFTALVYLVYLVRFLIRGHKGKPFFYFDEFLGAGFVGVIFAMGYVCIKGLIG